MINSTYNAAWMEGVSLMVPSEYSIFTALKTTGIHFARFCFHENLLVAGNCRACLLEVQNFEKPVPACVADLEAGQGLWTESLFSQKAKENIFETLLANHPLDCPICDQAGECDLQDQAKLFGGDRSRYFVNKRGVFDKNCHFFVKAVMTRCIHCTRCVRFNSSLNNSQLGILVRGTSSAIGNYVYKSASSNFFATIIDLCPVGALTARVQAFSIRPWEAATIESIDLLDGFGANLYISVKDGRVVKILPRPNKYLNGNIISDNCRFSAPVFTENRLTQPHLYNAKTLNSEAVSWYHWFKSVDVLKLKQRVLLLVSENLHTSAIEYLKKLNNTFGNKAQSFLLTKKQQKTNIFAAGVTSPLYDFQNKSNLCFFFATNPKVEAAIVNFKLKYKYKKTLLSVFGFGRAHSSDLKITFNSLSVKRSIKLLAAKTVLSSIASKALTPVYIFGRSFYDRFSITTFISTKLLSLCTIKLSIMRNEAGFDFLNFPTRTFKPQTSDLIFCVQIKDSVNLRKFALHKQLFWFNTHRPANFGLFSLIPVVAPIEEKGYYFNLEQKIQKAARAFNSPYKSKTLITLFSSLFDIKYSIGKSLKMILESFSNELKFFFFKPKMFINLNKCKSYVSKKQLKSSWR